MGRKSRTVFESVKPEIPNVRGSFGPDSGRRDGASGRPCHSRRPLGTGRCRPEAGGGVEGRSRRLPGVPASGLGSQGEERGPAGETKGGRGGWRTAGVTGPGVTGPRAGCCRTLFGCDKTATEPLNSASWWSLVQLFFLFSYLSPKYSYQRHCCVSFRSSTNSRTGSTCFWFSTVTGTRVF